MNDEIADTPEITIDPKISQGWRYALQPTHCPKCGVAYLIPAEAEKAHCPACFSAHLHPQPSVLRPEPPELLLDFSISQSQVAEKLKGWLKGVWLRPKELNPALLVSRLTKTFVPVWLLDGKVTGTWQAQMGYDYQVASSQEIYRSGGWSTRQLTETRIRWEPRNGTIERAYQNLAVPALEEHSRLMAGLGDFMLNSAPGYNPQALEKAAVRVPNLLPESAWSLAQSGFDRLAASDCQIASDAQHIEEYTIRAEYQDINWTQLLLPVYTTAYREEDGKIIPIMINGQNGRIFGLRQASQKQGWYWTAGILAVALICFLLGLGSSAGVTLLPALALIGGALFIISLAVGIAAPIPALWAWNFNRQEKNRQ
jgi:hypothetical protein